MRLVPKFTLLYLTWLLLLAAALYSAVTGQYEVTFTAAWTLALTLVPFALPNLIGVRLPDGFIVAIALFLLGTIFLGEMADFYERFWWWDMMLHGGSAIGLGLAGVILMLILLKGNRMTAAPLIVSIFAFSFAVATGVLWEIYEFAMDQLFGMNMQKSGLVDTMWDLIIDCVGAAAGAGAGYVYLTRADARGLVTLIRDFVGKNRHLVQGGPPDPAGDRSAPPASLRDQDSGTEAPSRPASPGRPRVRHRE